jgi:murein DD-endopeptidase MepM/ murein hydrolase activator NlpD
LKKQIGILAIGALLITSGILFVNSTSPIKTTYLKTVKALALSNSIEEVPAEIAKKFGIPTENFEIACKKIGKKELLSTILLRNHIPYPTIDKIVKKSNDVFDVRHIIPGKRYSIFTDKNDPSQKAKYFVYERDEINYVVVNLDDTVDVYAGKNDVEIRKKSVAGIINSSLYMTLKEQGVTPLLTYELADLFAWQIDFHRIQKGDRFKVIYEEKYVNGRAVGIGKIDAAQFNHFDDDYYAFYFEQEGVGEYFDDEAGSLRKAFLKAPVKYSRISSKYSPKRFHPVQKRMKAHLGTDYAAPTGTPIMAVGDGVVKEAMRKKYNGKYVKIKHNGTYTTQYLHMSKIAKGMKPGRKVRQGEIIGYVGSTGLATGPHVCFRFWKNGRQVDHLRQKFPPSRPVEQKYMVEYSDIQEKMILLLDDISYDSTKPIAMINL